MQFLDWLANGSMWVGTALLRNMYVCELIHALSKQPSDRSRDPAPPIPAIPSTGFFLPVGWFLPLRSLRFLYTHISLQQPYLFLNLAQVLWRIWKSNNSLFSSLSSFSLFLTLSLTISLPFHCYSVNWKIHLTSFPSNNELLICDFLCLIFKVHMHETSTLGCFCLSALPGSNNIPETSWVDPAPLPFHNFLLSHPLMGQIFYFWYIRFVAVINFHKNSCKNVATLKFSTATTILLQYIFSFDIFLVLQIHFLPLFFSTWRKQPNDCSQKCDETTDRWVDLANPLSLCGAAVEVLKWRIL